MSVTPKFATYSNIYLVTLNTSTGAYTIVSQNTPAGGLTIGDDANTTTPASSGGNGTETVGEGLYLDLGGANTFDLPDTNNNTTADNVFFSNPVNYTGFSASGEPIVAFNDYDYEVDPTNPPEATFYFLLSNNGSLTPSSGGTATLGVYTYCFSRGTAIATPAGECAVEMLAIGDEVLNAEGKAVAVKWIGRQTMSSFMARLHGELPVCISAGALGNGLPRRDLLVSPGHALLVDGVLVNAAALVNGTSIVKLQAWQGDVEYFHIETEAHEVILAEGAAAETFIDTVSRERFDNHAEYLALYPNAPAMTELDLPRVTHARQLSHFTQRRLAEVAAALADAEVLAA
jgi:hypothetical protein